MTKVLFERVKVKTGMHWHADRYKCSIVSNWLHYFFLPYYVYETTLDSVDYFVIYKTISRPYYKKIEYMKDGENIIEWLKNNITGACKVAVHAEIINDPDLISSSPIMDIKAISMHFTSKIDAMAFKLKFVE